MHRPLATAACCVFLWSLAAHLQSLRPYTTSFYKWLDQRPQNLVCPCDALKSSADLRPSSKTVQCCCHLLVLRPILAESLGEQQHAQLHKQIVRQLVQEQLKLDACSAIAGVHNPHDCFSMKMAAAWMLHISCDAPCGAAHTVGPRRHALGVVIGTIITSSSVP